MNRIKTNCDEMDQGGIDAILATEDELIPSSGFLASVMERVHDEARLPHPVPFPWKLAVPGILLAVGALGWSGFEMIRLGLPAVSGITLTLPRLSAALEQPVEQAAWVALALGASLLSWLLSCRLAGRSGLL